MLTRREFLAILMVMGTLLFLFQFLNVVRQEWNSYFENTYNRVKSTPKKASGAWRAADTQPVQIVYLGDDPEGSVGQAVKDLAQYQKQRFAAYMTSTQLEKTLSGKLPQMVVAELADAVWTDAQELASLQRLTEQGVHLVAASLPDTAVLKMRPGLRQLLGIAEIRSENVHAVGATLYEGFLLGGTVIYQARTAEEEAERQDLLMDMPWFTLAAGTKVYMKAMLEDPEIDVQEQPPILWRYNTGNGFVLVVNGPYFNGMMGVGLLAAFENEVQDTTVYPVLNAQNFVVGNAPTFAEENTAALQKRYSLTLRGILRDVVWSSLSLVASRGSMGLTCMMTPQTDYTDQNEPVQKDLQYYLQMIQAQSGEIGYSGWRHDTVPITEKIKQDADFWNEKLQGYRFTSLYRADLTQEAVEEALRQPLLSQVRTVVERPEIRSDVIGYQSENITRQSTLVDGFSYTYMDDLWVRCAETALGYTSILADLERMYYPQSEGDGWEKLSEKLASNVLTFWKPFETFAATTTAQTDDRIREFLALDYTAQTNAERITLSVTNAELPVWFLVRTHHKVLHSMNGGTFQKLERSTWLVQLDAPQASLLLEPEDTRYYTP